MANGVNLIVLVGRLGADPDIRVTKNGRTCANMHVCTSDSWRDKSSGEMQVKHSWHRVVAFDQRAEIARDWFKKGDLVYIQGKMNYRDWIRDGVKRTSAEIVIDKLEKISRPQTGGSTTDILPELPGDNLEDIPF